MLFRSGRRRYSESPEVAARERELKAAIRSRYAEEMAAAGLIRRWVLTLKMAFEFRRERRKLKPSDQTLFAQGV